MTVVHIVAAAMLLVAVLLAIVRLLRGPSNVDRILASDVMVVTLIGGVALAITHSDTSSALPILLALALVGFVGAVSVARFLVDRRGRER
ncbi:monovalent cation/H+ antiporter complex subunit F [Cumulibacter soli]|uniref:monovalent cation/H+ antiporter complex subunit F n=1 Tax=Cumulibacter soli TaxID=2546344 RepID=UPI0010688389|nr:monovalent cation/H+ antiporter complex subunit F [Cumulibacter soli]